MRFLLTSWLLLEELRQTLQEMRSFVKGLSLKSALRLKL